MRILHNSFSHQSTTQTRIFAANWAKYFGFQSVVHVYFILLFFFSIFVYSLVARGTCAWDCSMCMAGFLLSVWEHSICSHGFVHAHIKTTMYVGFIQKVVSMHKIVSPNAKRYACWVFRFRRCSFVCRQNTIRISACSNTHITHGSNMRIVRVHLPYVTKAIQKHKTRLSQAHIARMKLIYGKSGA